MQTWFAILVLTVLAGMLPAAAAEFFVAPGGSDANPGTREKPLATLAGARDAVRRLKRAQPRGDITVLFAGGTYRLANTVVFSLEDSGSPEQAITYAALPGEKPVFSGAMPVGGWRKAEPAPPGLPAAARGKAWVADVSFVREAKAKQAPPTTVAEQHDRGWRFLTLFQGDRRLPRARGAGFSVTGTGDRRASDRRALHFPKGVLRNWPGLADAELAIIPMYFWISNILPLESVDEAAGIARTTVHSTYPMGMNGMRDRPTAWAENVLEVLDRPGEWVLDTANARLYLWPEGERPSEDLAVPILAELVRVEGAIDYEGPEDRPVTHLTFRGLTFTQGDRLSWHGLTGWGLQHDWERFDSPTALVRLRGAEHCAIEECRFANAGGTGIRLDLHCLENRIVGNHLERLGGVGILLAGYGPGTKDANRRNEVTNNYIHHIGELYWGSPALFAWQSSENRIAHNHIHSIPYTGICVTGRISWDPKGQGECSRTVRWKETGSDPAKPPRLSWRERERFLHGRKNIIERNDIHHVMQVTGDGNCIYVSGTGAGNIVRENYCHDCDGRYMNAAIRCDDDQHGTLIERNIIYRTRGYAEGTISKGANDIIENLVVDLRPHDHHRGYFVFPYGSPQGSRVEGNVLYSREKGQVVCGEGRGRGAEPPSRLRDTKADRNLYWCAEDPAWGAAHLERERAFGIEANSRSADPLFTDLEREDFRFRPGSPALEMGIAQPIAVDLVGLQSPYRGRLIGRRIRTRITPEGGMLRKPVRVALACDDAGAEIRYALDGAEPTPASRRYTEPFILSEPAIVRARSFAAGATDLAGATAEFTPPPQPLREDFESCRVGAPAPRTQTMEENATMTARVTDERAASGKQSLKVVDGPGQQHSFNPHLFYRLRHTTGKIVGRFALFVEPAATLSYQWRDYSGGGFHRGPALRVSPGGRLSVSDKELLVIPTGAWVRLEVACTLGQDGPLTFDLRVQVPGQPQPSLFTGLACEPGFHKLDWVGFIAPAQDAAAFYLDDIEVEEAPEAD